MMFAPCSPRTCSTGRARAMRSRRLRARRSPPPTSSSGPKVRRSVLQTASQFNLPPRVVIFNKQVSSCMLERGLKLTLAQNQEYVMWFHSDSSNYGAAEVGVATAKSPCGPYAFKSSFKPLGADSRDMGLFQDGKSSLLYNWRPLLHARPR